MAAGNALFHVVVDTDATAAKLMKKLEDKKLGRVTFMPLSRLRVPSKIDYPDSNDVVPIIKRCVKFNPAVKAAMTMIFGRKLLAKNMEAASLWSKNFDMDAVTMDGDEVNSKGALQGGFLDSSRSRLAAYDSVQRSKGKLDKLSKDHKDLSQKAAAVDQTIANLVSDIQKMEAKKANLQHVLEQTAKENAARRSRTETRQIQADQQAEALPPMRLAADSLQMQVKRLEDEVGTALSTTLTVEERATLTDLHEVQKAQEEEIEKVRRDFLPGTMNVCNVALLLLALLLTPLVRFDFDVAVAGLRQVRRDVRREGQAPVPHQGQPHPAPHRARGEPLPLRRLLLLLRGLQDRREEGTPR